MLRASQKKKFAPAHIGHTVRVQVLDVNGGCTDNRNVLAIVVEIEDFYKLANENGTLKQLYTRNQFVICKEKLLSIHEIYFQEMPLREAAAANSTEAEGKAIHVVIAKGSIPQINAVVKARASCAIQSVIIV
ncbi:KRAB-A domain-containing protein 2 [Trichonephila clavipes]|nr:KRAB-A domain-containing protein 2 [Trichonephila clavipes]